MPRIQDHGLFMLGLCLALGMIVSMVIAARAYERVRIVDQTITVKGYADAPITSDHGVWSGQFTVEGADLPTAYAAVERDLDRVVQRLVELGVDPEAIRASAVDMAAVYHKDKEGKSTHQVAGYRMTRSVTVEGADLQLIERVAVQSTSLLRQGVAFSSGEPAYFYSKFDAVKIQMLGESMKDAKARAAVLAENSGSKVGALVQADQGVFQITPPHTTEVSDYGQNNTGTILKVIKAVITAEFRVE